MDGIDKGRGGGGETKVAEQVTIVRLAIEEILEEAILVFDYYACTHVRMCAYEYTRVHKSHVCVAHERKRCSSRVDRRHG